MNLSRDIKNLATSMGVDLVGVAPVERFANAPDEGKPQYYLRDAQNVVVMATRILQGICDVHGSYEEEGKTIGPYSWFGYPILNWFHSWAAIQISKLLEDKGYKAIPFPPAGFMYRHPQQGPDFSHRHAAVAAGLGEFGHNRLLLTPQFGAHQRILSIVTNAPLEPDPLYGGARLCQREKCKDLCVRICPMKSFESETVTVDIGDRTYECALLDSQTCFWNGVVGRYLRGTEELPRYPDAGQIAEIYKNAGGRDKVIQKMHPSDRAFQQFTFTPTCGACLVKCPAPWK